MKVRIITAEYIWDLEQEINKFLNFISNDQIIDIKYQGIGNHAGNSVDRPSAMLILK